MAILGNTSRRARRSAFPAPTRENVREGLVEVSFVVMLNAGHALSKVICTLCFVTKQGTEQRSFAHFACREDPDDPERIVVFDDISMFVVPFETRESQVRPGCGLAPHPFAA